jgi:soluble lytic murein transglycosylase-like protein
MPLRTLAAVLVLIATLASCTSSSGEDTPAPTARKTPSPTIEVTVEPTVEPEPEPELPAADAALPTEPQALADEIVATEERLRSMIDEYVAEGARPASKLGQDVELLALYQQRIFRALTKNERLEGRVIPLLTGKVRKFYEGTIAAQEELASITGTSETVPEFEFAKAEAPNRLWRYFREGERRFRIPDHMLAAVMFIESKFGKVLGPSVAGALGPMQFLPSTWEAYSGGGDIMDPHDSVIGAARYLNASGGPERMRDALFAYNPTEPYVNAIQIYARQIARDEKNFYMYYFWQVFVSTEQGDVQLTGPGTKRDLT